MEQPPSYEEAVNQPVLNDHDNDNEAQELSFTDTYINMILTNLHTVLSNKDATDKDKDAQIQKMNELIKIKKDHNPKILEHTSVESLIKLRDQIKNKYEIKKFVSFNEHVEEVRAAYPTLPYLEARKKASKSYAPIREERLIYEFHAECIETTRNRNRSYLNTIEETINGLKNLLADLTKNDNPDDKLFNWVQFLKKVTEDNPTLNRNEVLKKAKHSYKPFKTFTKAKNLWGAIYATKLNCIDRPKTQIGILKHLIHCLEAKAKTFNSK